MRSVSSLLLGWNAAIATVTATGFGGSEGPACPAKGTAPCVENDRNTVTQMLRSNLYRTLADAGNGLLRLVAVTTIATTLAGCGLSSVTSGLGGGLFGSDEKSASVNSVTEEQLLSAAKADFGGGSVGANVAHGCPRFVVWSPGHHTTTYLPGREGDSMAVMHRGEITKTARECQIEPGRVTVKYGFSGRVLLGPAGQTARVNLPVKVFINDADRQRLSSEDMTIGVDVSVANPIGYFSQVKTVTFAIPEGTRPGDYEVLVGFDRATTAPAAATNRF